MLWLAHFGITLVAARLVGARLPGGPWPTWAVFVGAVLPDLVDKPLSLMMPFWSGRHVAHSVLFVLVLGLAARVDRSHRPVLVALAFGSALHLVLDSMWHVPHALWWPVLGIGVPHEPDTVARYVGYLGGRTALVWEAVGVALLVVWSLERAGRRAVHRRPTPAAARSGEGPR